MNRLTVFCALWLILVPYALCAPEELSLVPLPAQVEQGQGQYTVARKLSVYVPDSPGDSVQRVWDNFARKWTAAAGTRFVRGKAGKADVRLVVNPSLGHEAYVLQVQAGGIVVEAARPAGFFYALQTLAQLFPSRAVAAGVADGAVRQCALPVVRIADEPRFGWRGFMLDEGRHFYGKEAVKQILDVMAAYKMNRFHWHLTEDQGWRLEIKKYPKLTEVGAWRDSKVLGWGDVKPDGQHYGGYYTQDDVREVVAYAAERFIEVVPEVDIPGHSQAAVAAYPEVLACDPENPHEVWLMQGVSDDVMNVANPAAVQFAKDVIDELTELFPFGYIHLGGDECPTDKWKKNAQCRDLLASIGSENYRDLQLHFYKQLKDYMAGKPASQQRKLIFWNEVLHGNTGPLGRDITIMAWVGADAAAREAAARGMQTILTPQIPYYINRRQSALPTEPRSQGQGTETVEAVYGYVPLRDVPDSLQSRYLGVQANFWTEWVEDASTVQYLMLPRLAAVAEAGWTPQARRDYPDFVRRVQAEAAYYGLAGLNYGRHIFESQAAE